MPALALMKWLAKALIRQIGQYLGLAWVGDLLIKTGEEACKDWDREKKEKERRAEIKALVHQVGFEICGQVEKLVIASRPKTRTPNGVFPITMTSPPAVARVMLTLVQRNHPEQEFVFEERTTCILGKESDCHPRFPKDAAHRYISRHHCLLDINPPDIRVRDLGSKNGTWVNGELIGKRSSVESRAPSAELEAEEPALGAPHSALHAFKERDLHDGDELALGKTGTVTIRIRIEVPPPQGQRRCIHCGREVAEEIGIRPGDYICLRCRQDPAQILHNLQTEFGEDLPEIQGYTILQELGRGGTGGVWLARHQRTNQLRALKMMLPSVAADERAVKRFLDEMAKTRMLNHPHLVRILDVGFSRNIFFIGLEYCDGGSVARLMQDRGGTLPLDEAVEITFQALEGLHHAHNLFGPGKGLIHRDLKPENLFLAGQGSARLAKIGDYGLAKAFDEAGMSGSTRTGEVAGTPSFMPRQQVINFKYARPDVDIWAMAASLYNMLTGFVPRDFPPDQDPWLTVLETPPIPILKRNPHLPSRIAKVIDHALVESPEIPFATAVALREALEAAL